MLTMDNSNNNITQGKDYDSAARRIADLASDMRSGQTEDDTRSFGPYFQPDPLDVICARGKRAFQHAGNRRFRDIIDSKIEQYASATTKFEKSLIVSQVVDEVRHASPGGGFVRSEKGVWFEVGDNIAREKVGQR